MYQLVLAILFIAIGHPSDGLIAWKDDYKLQWSDFKGEPQDHIDAVAIAASGLSSSFSARTTSTELLDYTATIVAHFYPESSWYRPDRVNEIVLAHEQLHFDITELHARKLRRDIATYDFTLNIKSEMSALQEKANKDLEIMQDLYDSQSNFSMEVEAQKKWQIYIRAELQKLANYK